MRWRLVGWILRLALLAAVLYGVWLVASHFVGKHYFAEGMRHLATDPRAAARSFETAVKLQPRNPRYRASLGRAYLKQKDYVSAAKHLQEAAERKPDDFGLWHDLGEACLKSDSPVGATEAFRKALEIRPNAPQPLAGLAEAAVQADDWEAALDPLRKLWSNDPTNFETGSRLAKALVTTGHNDEALKVCGSARGRLAGKWSAEGASWVPGEGQETPGESFGMACGFWTAEGDAHRAKGQWGPAVGAYLASLAVSRRDAAAREGLGKVPAEVARPVTTTGYAAAPAFSPDGQKLAFAWLNGDERGLYVLDQPASQPRKVAELARDEPGVRPPAWSPDGSLICYANEKRLWLVGSDGSGGRPLVKNRLTFPQLLKLGLHASKFDTLDQTADAFPTQSDPAWAPDGRHIAYCASGKAGAVTCVVDVTTGQARSTHRTTGTLPKFEAVFPPAWSSDGRVICGPLSYATGGKDGVTIWSAAGEVKRQLAVPARPSEATGQAVAAAVWAPDARHIAVATHESEGTVSLALVESSGKSSKVVARNVLWGWGRPGTFAKWRDASHVQFLKLAGKTPADFTAQVMVSDLSGKTSGAKTSFPLVPLGTDWDLSRDGKRLAVTARGMSESGEGTALWVFDLEALRKG